MAVDRPLQVMAAKTAMERGVAIGHTEEGEGENKRLYRHFMLYPDKRQARQARLMIMFLERPQFPRHYEWEDLERFLSGKGSIKLWCPRMRYEICPCGDELCGEDHLKAGALQAADQHIVDMMLGEGQDRGAIGDRDTLTLEDVMPGGRHFVKPKWMEDLEKFEGLHIATNWAEGGLGGGGGVGQRD